jgi:hypothetical protein
MVLILLGIGAWMALRPTPLPLQRLAAPAQTSRPPPTVIAFEVPGPQGRAVLARFYGLERLRPTGDDLCEGLTAALPRIAPVSGDLGELAPMLRRACGTDPDAAGLPTTAADRIALAAALLSVVMQEANSGRGEIDWATLGARWAVRRLREASGAEEVEAILNTRCAPTPQTLPLRRVQADCTRIRAAFCPAGPERAMCQVRFLASAGEELARLGRLETNEQHFRDMAEVLDEAEALLRSMPENDERRIMLDGFATAFGYAGEAGRDRRLLLRAHEIAAANLAELGQEPEPGQDGFRFARALDALALALSRLAAGDADRVAATRRAVAAQRRAIDFRERFEPEAPSWAAQVNLAADLLDLFALTNEAEAIEQSVAFARASLTTLGRAGPFGIPREPEDVLYVKARLGQALAWQGRRAPDLPDETRERLLAEARTLLEEAERAFARMNARAYHPVRAGARAGTGGALMTAARPVPPGRRLL